MLLYVWLENEIACCVPQNKTEKKQSFALLSLRDEGPAHRSFENLQ